MKTHRLIEAVRKSAPFRLLGRRVVRALTLRVRTEREDVVALSAQLGVLQPAVVHLVHVADQNDVCHGFWLNALRVQPAFRRMGIGTWLCRQTLDMARRMGADTVLLTVREDNASAIALYERLGFSTLPSDGALAPELQRLEAIEKRPYRAMECPVRRPEPSP